MSPAICDGLKRREFLRVGTVGGLSLASLLRMQDAAVADSPAKPKRDVNCIFIFTLGGMPQHDLWDFKPDAPAEIRGDFQSIPTVVPGLHLTDLLPRTAQIADKLAVLRGMTHGDSDHGRGYHIMMTGMTPGPGDFNSTKNNTREGWKAFAYSFIRFQFLRVKNGTLGTGPTAADRLAAEVIGKYVFPLIPGVRHYFNGDLNGG